MLKGYRTYLAIILTAAVVLAGSFGYVDQSTQDVLVAVLSSLGLYFRAQATK